jgi:hypothetical protein
MMLLLGLFDNEKHCIGRFFVAIPLKDEVAATFKTAVESLHYSTCAVGMGMVAGAVHVARKLCYWGFAP